ncbi:unnamed protein product [Meloidogyne enterolobii]|uniref:Uncharacterized protein n=1 Tax=Meloidogyne enterolobii TaxID=390850 RepID=A0ACB1B5T6_MELEN
MIFFFFFFHFFHFFFHFFIFFIFSYPLSFFHSIFFQKIFVFNRTTIHTCLPPKSLCLIKKIYFTGLTFMHNIKAQK